MHARHGTQALLEQLDRLLSASPAVHFVLRAEAPGVGHFDWISDNVAGVTGYPLTVALAPGWWLEHIHPDDRDRVLATFDQLPRRGELHCEYRFLFHTQGYRWLRDQRRLGGEVRDGAYEALGSWLDITDMHSTQSRLHEREQLLRKIIETEPECVKLVDAEGIILEINPAGLGMLQSGDPGEVIGQSALSFVAPEYKARLQSVMRRVLSGEPAILEMEILGRKGRRRRVESHAAPLYGPDGRVRSLLMVTRDISERADAESQVHYLAHYDLLTGLPNRALFRDRLLQAMAQAKRTDTLLSVMFLDIDHFKDINDTLGHAVGDQLLKEIAQRIRACVRETDTVARFGGDEFGLIQTNLHTVEGAADLASRLVESIAEAYHIEGHEIHTGASVGVTIYPFDDHNAEDLLKNADMAMYKAKR
ncbi:MAG: diguanylate cyclase, partial [Gammaproteobacteria bacterium]|nr:diguanylate cyclase [Gammaproteobacteria bacterium]